jgi:hypothetical protein
MAKRYSALVIQLLLGRKQGTKAQLNVHYQHEHCCIHVSTLLNIGNIDLTNLLVDAIIK